MRYMENMKRNIEILRNMKRIIEIYLGKFDLDLEDKMDMSDGGHLR